MTPYEEGETIGSVRKFGGIFCLDVSEGNLRLKMVYG
jgi:hypothetical protein